MNDKINEMRDYGCSRKMLTSNKQTSHINTVTYFSILSVLCSVIKLVYRYCDFTIDLCNCFVAQSHIGFHGQPMSQFTNNKQYMYINLFSSPPSGRALGIFLLSYLHHRHYII